MNKKTYSYFFMLPAFLIFLVIFITPTITAFFFSLTRWTLFDWKFIGFDNFVAFFQNPYLSAGLKHSFIYVVLTSGSKVILGLLLAVFLCSGIKTKNYLRVVVFFPTIISTVAVGVIFKSLMNPRWGLINKTLGAIGINGPSWLGDPNLALYSVILVDLWIGLGLSTIIYIAGLMTIPDNYYEACKIDGGD